MIAAILKWLTYLPRFILCILQFYLFNGLLLYRLARAFVAVKEQLIFKLILFLLLTGTSGMVIWVGDNNFLLTFPVFMVLYMLSTAGPKIGRLATAVVFFCLIMSVSAILDTYMPDTRLYDMLTTVLRPVFYGVLYLSFRRRLPREPVRLSQRLWKLVLGLSVMPLCALIAVVLLTYQKYEFHAVYALSTNQGLVVLPFALLTSAMILRVILTLADYELLIQENRLASLREIYYQGIQREQTSVRTLRHDLKNHLSVLMALAEQGETQRLQDYLSQLLGAPALQGSRQLCENETANAVLASKAEEMVQKGLEGSFQISLPRELPIADMDLCALIGNALDNAMEAAVKASDPHIQIRCRTDKGMLILQTTNALAGDEKTDLSTTKQNSKSHGFGLPGMREIAARYGGSIETSVSGGQFELLVCLPLDGAKEL